MRPTPLRCAAVACGVEVLAYGVRLTHEEMVIDRRLDVLLNG
jgi:sugar fermentation stimulation protein A